MTKDVFKQFIRSMDEQFSLYEWFARQYGLQRKSMQILFWVKNYPEMTGQLMTQKRLAEKTYSSKQVVNATIKSWRAKGYVELLENPADKRHKLVQLTETGKLWASTIYDKLSELERQAAMTLTEEEQSQLTQLTIKYNRALREEMEKAYDSF